MLTSGHIILVKYADVADDDIMQDALSGDIGDLGGDIFDVAPTGGSSGGEIDAASVQPTELTVERECTISPGSVFGSISLMPKSRYTYSAAAASDSSCDILAIKCTEFAQILSNCNGSVNNNNYTGSSQQQFRESVQAYTSQWRDILNGSKISPSSGGGP